MKTALVTAEFVGLDGSLGFRTGKRYALSVLSRPDGKIYIERGARQYCLYDNILLFFQNWNHIDTVNE